MTTDAIVTPARADRPEATADHDGLSERVRALRLPPQVVSGGSAGGRIAWLLCALLAGTVAILGFMLYRVRATDAPPAATAELPAVDAAAVADDPFTLESKGYIIPARQILVSPQVSGRIVKLNVVEGMRVREGEVLAQLEDIDYRADLRRAEASLRLSEEALRELERGNRPEEIKQAEAELAEAEAQQKYLSDVVKRNAGLVRSNVLSQEDYEESASKSDAMERRVAKLRYGLDLMRIGPREERIAMARADVDRAKAELTKAQWRLDNCTIRAPISGTILRKNAEEGNIVNPIAFNGSFSLCDMADLSDLEVDLSIQERDIAQIAAGQRCQVRAEAYPDRPYPGYVARLMPIADRAKGAVPVRVKIAVPREEEGVYLKPEMGAIVSFLKEPKNGAASAGSATATTAAPNGASRAAATLPAPAATQPPRDNPDAL